MTYAYQDRVRAQTLAWAQGRPYHNHVDDECCPDFSCCNPDLFETDEGKRWQHYKGAHAMTSQWSSNDVDLLSLNAAHEIEDIFCRSWAGQTQRLAAIQAVVSTALNQLWADRIARAALELKPMTRDITDAMVAAAKRVLAREYSNTNESWDRLIKMALMAALKEPTP